jgi:hypothetical protein
MDGRHSYIQLALPPAPALLAQHKPQDSQRGSCQPLAESQVRRALALPLRPPCLGTLYQNICSDVNPGDIVASRMKAVVRLKIALLWGVKIRLFPV